MRRPAHRASGPTMGDRLWHAVGCAAIGAFWGAVVAGAWVYLGHPFSASPIVLMGAGAGLLALFMGDAVADLLAAPFHLAFGVLLGATDAADVLPSGYDDHDKASRLPTWLKLVFWVGFFIGVLIWLRVI